MNILTKWKIRLGFICPEHQAPTYYDSSYDKMRCSVTDQPVRYERKV